MTSASQSASQTEWCWAGSYNAGDNTKQNWACLKSEYILVVYLNSYTPAHWDDGEMCSRNQLGKLISAYMYMYIMYSSLFEANISFICNWNGLLAYLFVIKVRAQMPTLEIEFVKLLTHLTHVAPYIVHPDRHV